MQQILEYYLLLCSPDALGPQHNNAQPWRPDLAHGCRHLGDQHSGADPPPARPSRLPSYSLHHPRGIEDNFTT